MPDTNQPTIFNAFFRMNSRDPSDLPPPILSEFDERVLKLCGDWGSKPTKNEFIAMLNEPEHKDVVNSIYKSLEHTVITKDADIKTFITELAQIWFDQNGFAYVFAGEPKNNVLRGMHFAPRLLEAQQKYLAGKSQQGNYMQSVHNAAYTTEVDFINLDNKPVKGKVDKDKSFDKSLHADDILIYGTLMFKMLKDKRGTLYYGLNGYTGVFIKNRNAVVTFYPDLSRSISYMECDSDSDTEQYYSLPESDLQADGSGASKKDIELPGDNFYAALEKLIGNTTKSIAIEPGTTQSRAK